MKVLQVPVKLVLSTGMLYLIIYSCNDGGKEASQLTASAGNDINTLVGQRASLNGTGSSDAGGVPFDYLWSFISKPPQSNAELDDSSSPTPSFTPDVAGKYKIELEVSNTTKSSDTVTVSAFNVTQAGGSFQNLSPGPDAGVRHFDDIFGELCATCEFTEIGGVAANKIACFDGSKWYPLGCGLEEGSIYGMIGYKGELYVAGDFDEIGCISASKIARWNGSAWNPVAGGLTGGSNPFGYAFAIFNDELYVGGQFERAGTVPAINIAKWNGNNWAAVGSFENGSVRVLEVYKDKLYAGGFFTTVNGAPIRNIASYNGNTWSALGPLEDLELQATGSVRHMAVLNDKLFISGDFEAGGNEYSELITWDGTKFNDFGRAFSLFPNNTIEELSSINGILFIGGKITNAVASHPNNILQWDGENWGLLGQGVSGTVLSIELFDNKIYIGGDFMMAGGKGAENISIWVSE